MHELGVTRSIIETIIRESKKNNILPKIAVVELGTLTTYKKDSIGFYFEALKKEQGYEMLNKAKLQIVEVPGQLVCNKCKKITDIKDNILIMCRNCDSDDVVITKGRDVIIREIKGEKLEKKELEKKGLEKTKKTK